MLDSNRVDSINRQLPNPCPSLTTHHSIIRYSGSASLRPRMKLPVYGLKPLLIDMGVNLRCRNICVAEHFLNDAQVGAIAQQMRRKTVPEKMGINVLLQPGVPRTFFYDLPDARRC